MNRQKINIVDEDGKIIGSKYRDEIDYFSDRYQSTGLWVVNSNNEVLIAQRKFTKDKDPGLWGPAVAGTVDEGETFESNIYKEAEEEIGLIGVKFELGPLYKIDSPKKYFGQWFIARVDNLLKEFTPQESEVERLAWIKKDELVKDIKESPDKYIPLLSKFINDLITY